MEFKAPQNFKRGKLIMGAYRLSDLMWLIAGVVSTFLLIAVYVVFAGRRNVLLILLFLLPSLLGLGLTLPMGTYHNAYEFLSLKLHNSFTKNTYIWEGVYRNEIDTQDIEEDV